MHNAVFLFLNIGTGELMLIFFVALLLFGGDKLPGLARGLGRGIRDFKNASEDVKREINNQINSFDDKKEQKHTPALTAEEHYVAEDNTPAEKEDAEIENSATDNNVDDTKPEDADNDSANTASQPGRLPDFTKPANTVEYKS